MKFINREDELKFLESEYKKTDSSLVVVYGRRRIGKTCLISEFVKNKDCVYFLATEESETQNIKSFQKLIAEFINNSLLTTAKINEWEILFTTLIQQIKTKKIVIVIDEFQYLAKGNSAFPSIFQKIWDTVLKDKNVMVILCGSLINMMTNQVLSYSSPLYGRRTGQIKLQQIDFRHYNEFFPDLSYRQLIEYYSVTGGVPRYIEIFSETKDIYKAIEKFILSKQSFLYEEPLFLLQNEVSEIGSYFSIIKSIADGNRKISKISADISVSQTNLPKYLKTLIDLDIIERQVPITEKNPEKSKMGLYCLRDNFIEFWFKFVYPNKSHLEQGNAQYVMDIIHKYFFERQAAFVYENVCKTHLWDLNRKGALSFNKAGRWWNKDTEIDIVALNEDENLIIFSECKYTKNPADTDLFYNLLEKKNKVVWGKTERNEKYVLFSISGYTKELQNISKQRNDLILYKHI